MVTRHLSSVVAGAAALVFATPAIAAQPAGQVLAVRHTVEVERGQRHLPAKPSMPLAVEDAVTTAARSRAKLYFRDDSILNLGEKSRVEVEEYLATPGSDRTRSIYRLLDGSMRVVVGRSNLEIHTPTAVAAARGTHFVVTVNRCGDNRSRPGSNHGDECFDSCLYVLSGTVSLHNIDPKVGDELLVGGGQMSCVESLEPPDTPRALSKEGKKRVIQQTTVMAQTAGDRLTSPLPTQVVRTGSRAIIHTATLSETAEKKAHWVIAASPAGSTATVADPQAATPAFTADRSGDYVLQLLPEGEGEGAEPLRTAVVSSRPNIEMPEAAAIPAFASSPGEGEAPVLPEPEILIDQDAALALPVAAQEPTEATTPVTLRIQLP